MRSFFLPTVNTSLFYPLSIIVEILVIFTVDALFLYLNSEKLNRMKVSNVNNNSLYK